MACGLRSISGVRSRTSSSWRATASCSESKVSTTPDDPSRAVVAGVAALLEELDLNPARVEEVLHGTTVGSNTLLQRSGARTGLITTRGFRDVLEIGRIRMPDMFDLTWDKPKPLVPRRHRLEVAERIAADGSVVEPLDEASVVAAGAAIVRSRHRGRRRLPHQQLPQSRPRAAHRGDPARTLPSTCWSPPPGPCCPSARSTSAPAPRW